MRLGFGLGLQYSKLSGGGGGNTDAFTIEVKTDNTGTSNDNQFQFTGAQGDYDVVAKQGGVIVETFSDLSDAATITFTNGVGTYILEVTPKEVNPFNKIEFDNNGDKFKILDISNWGLIVWKEFLNAFHDCRNMTVTATDSPDLSNVIFLTRMFSGATLANPNTSEWDVSNVELFLNMFRDASTFNKDVSKWDMTKAEILQDMFRGATSFNQPLNNWNVSNVTNMTRMFQNASAFNQDCSNWNVSNVTDMSSMFEGSALSPENLDKLYIKWANLPSLQNNVPFGAANTKRTSASTAAKNFIIDTYGWNITDNDLV
jgi:surface protein